MLSLVWAKMRSCSSSWHCSSCCCQVVLRDVKHGLFCRTAAWHGGGELPRLAPALAACMVSAALLTNTRTRGCEPCQCRLALSAGLLCSSLLPWPLLFLQTANGEPSPSECSCAALPVSCCSALRLMLLLFHHSKACTAEIWALQKVFLVWPPQV